MTWKEKEKGKKEKVRRIHAKNISLFSYFHQDLRKIHSIPLFDIYAFYTNIPFEIT